MKTRTLSLVAALAMIGCSSKFDENGQTPQGEDAYADNGEDETNDDTDNDDEDEDPLDIDADNDGFSPNDGDCDDEDEDINPDADEVCDGIDNNCNDRIDEMLRFDTYFVDGDGDGYGDPENEVEWCAPVDEYVEDNTDCDDTDPAVNPGAEEVIGDEIDNDCDNQIDERFDTGTVSEDGNVGSASSIQVDASGQVHIVFYDEFAGDLLYAKRGVEGRWAETETIASDDNSGEFVDAVVDNTGVLHVSYTEANAYIRGLLYTQRSASGTWIEPLIVDGFEPGEIDIGQYVSMDLDTWNLPSFGYFDADIGEPVVADMTIIGVAVYVSADNNYMGTLFEEAHTGLYTSLALDSMGNDHIAFYDPYASGGTGPEVQYSAFNLDLDDLVYSETIDDAGQYISLAIRGDDVPCVAFQTMDTLDLKYGCYEDGAWNLEVLDESGAVGAYATLDFNSYDEAYIAYYDQTHTRLKMAREYKGEAWEIIEIDNDGNVGQAASIHVDGRGIAHISYYDASRQALKYATGN
jgi:hypothetical protein